MLLLPHSCGLYSSMTEEEVAAAAEGWMEPSGCNHTWHGPSPACQPDSLRYGYPDCQLAVSSRQNLDNWLSWVYREGGKGQGWGEGH